MDNFQFIYKLPKKEISLYLYTFYTNLFCLQNKFNILHGKDYKLHLKNMFIKDIKYSTEYIFYFK
jgi:hypothetical protein